MGRLSPARADRAAVDRDLVWALLWAREAWVPSKAVFNAWLGGRPFGGCAFYADYISRDAITRHLNRLVVDGRAEVSRSAGRHPLYRATEPSA